MSVLGREAGRNSVVILPIGVWSEGRKREGDGGNVSLDASWVGGGRGSEEERDGQWKWSLLALVGRERRGGSIRWFRGKSMSKKGGEG